MSRRIAVIRLLEGLARRLGGAEAAYVGPDEPRTPVDTRATRARLIVLMRVLDDLADAPASDENRSRLYAIDEALTEIENELGARGGEDGK